MLDNYFMDALGGIHQMNRKPFVYDHKYCEVYDTPEYKRAGYILNTLRLAFVKLNTEETWKLGPLLDFGYGNGDFLKVAKEYYPSLYAYDIADYEAPEGVCRIKSYDREALPFARKQFHVTTFWDSLEHIPDWEFLRTFPSMYIVVSMPYCHYRNCMNDMEYGYNLHSDRADDWFTTWKHRKPDEHLHFHDPSSLSETMKAYGWSPVIINNDIEDIVRKGSRDERGYSVQNIFTALYKR